MKRVLNGCAFLLLAVLLMTFAGTGVDANAATSYKFRYKEYYKNTKIKYNGTVPNYTVDGKAVDTSNTPGIINAQEYAMCNAKAVFRAAGVNVNYSYKNQNITFKYHGNKLILYLNSDKAVFNGNEIKSPCISYKVKYYPSGKKVIFVPSRFVAETLKMDYTWDSSSKTAKIITPIEIEYNGTEHLYAGSKGALKVNGEAVDNSDYPSLIFSSNAMLALDTAFEALDEVDYSYNASEGELELVCGDISIRMITGNRYAYVNGILETCPVAPMVITNKVTGTTDLYFPGRYVFETLGFSYSWDESNKTSVIKTVEGKTGVFNKDYEIVAVYDAGLMPGNDGSYDENAIVEEDIDYRQVFKLLLPDDYDKSKLDLADLLYENKIRAELAGDYREFYADNKLVNTGEALIQINILYFADRDVTQINLCTRTNADGMILGHKDRNASYGMRLILDKPVNLYDKIIILDAGHGGSDPGTQHGGYNEKDVNFSVIYKHCKQLFDKSDIKVYYSRYDDTLPSLYDRAGLAARVGADFFISVHHNSNNNSKAAGTSVYYSTEEIRTFPVINNVSDDEAATDDEAASTDGEEAEDELSGVLTSKIMAQMFLDALLDKLGTNNRGIIDKGFVVVGKNNTVPSVLLEIGFMSNPDELKKIVTNKFQKNAAKAIYQTVLDIYEQYGNEPEDTEIETELTEDDSEDIESEAGNPDDSSEGSESDAGQENNGSDDPTEAENDLVDIDPELQPVG